MRKTHRKSRKGCSQCKQRHVKCNEAYPRCANCARLEIACSFQEVSRQASDASPSPATPLVATSVLASCSLNPVDLELLHNYTLRTAITIHPTEDGRGFFRDNFVRLGFASSQLYVLHAILGVSALHIISEDPSRVELFAVASAHQNAALRLVQQHIRDLTQEHSIAMFAFSGFMAIYGLAEASCRQNPSPNLNPIDDLVGCMNLYRGVKAVIAPFGAYLRSSWMGSLLMLSGDVESNARATKEGDYEIPLRRLRAMTADEPSDENREQCLSAVENLFTMMTRTKSSRVPHETHGAHRWMVETHPLFVKMIAARRPLALVILAHYTVLLAMCRTSWWLREWPMRLMSQIEDTLAEDWKEALEWPKMAIQSEGLTPSSVET